MADESYWNEQFESKGKNRALPWRLCAGNLLRAAECLLIAVGDFASPTPETSRLVGPMMLLRAAAVEALLKARAVGRGHRFVVNGEFNPIPGTGNGHDLLRIARQTSFDLDDQETDLLSRLSWHLELGRYPIGKKWSAGLKQHQKPEIGYVIEAFYSTADEETFGRLVERLEGFSE